MRVPRRGSRAGALVKPTVARFVVFAPNWLGDAVMALPAIADVRRALPDASLTIAARPAIAPLFSMVPGIDDVVVWLRERSRARAIAAPFRYGDSAAQFVSRGVDGLASRHARALGISDRLAPAAADARDRSAGRASIRSSTTSTWSARSVY